MKQRTSKHYLAILLASLLFSISCNKSGNNSPEPRSRNIKFEISGNFSGKLLLVYTREDGNGNTTVNDVSVPWSRELVYASNVKTIGVGGNASAVGVAGQKITFKIYSGNSLVVSGDATAGSLGEIVIPALTFSF
jgi:hypothetical protein